MKIKIKTAIVCFFTTSKGGHGTAEVSLGLFKSINGKKKLIEFKEKKIKDKLVLRNIKKFIFIFKSIIRLKKFFSKNKKNIIFIEGASWVGFSFLFLILSKILLNNIIIVYHAHNIEYEIRLKKNNFFIAFLTKIFEKYVYLKSDIATSVSDHDQKKIKKLYNINSYVFLNGVHSERLKVKKITKNIPKNFYLYSGSYLYQPNKVALDELINKLYPIIIKKYPNLYLIITGEGLPVELIKNKKIIHFKYLKKENLNYLTKKAKFLLLPLKKAPGTKLKIIEALLIGSQIITTKHGMKGIKFNNYKQPFVYKDYNQIFKFVDYIMCKNTQNRISLNKSSNFYRKEFILENIIKKFQSNNYKYFFK